MTQISGITLYQPTQYIWFIIHNPQIRYTFFKFVFIRVEIFHFKSNLPITQFNENYINN